MSRSIQRPKCTRVGCLVCKPHKVTGERPISERRAPSTADVPTGHWFIVDPYDCDEFDSPWPWHPSDADGPTVAPEPLTFRPFARAA